MASNPYAFPASRDSFLNYGMTLRDYFAAVALQGLLSDNRINDRVVIEFAHASYRYADAMLEVREKP